MVNYEALQHGNQRAAHNGGGNDARSRARKLAQAFGAQRENSWEHNGIEKSNQQQRPWVTAPPPAAIASSNKPTAIEALNAKYLLGAILFIKPAPIKRPTIAPPQ